MSNNEVLNSLLREYEQKKLRAELDLEKRKEDLYKQYPKLQEIEEELNNFAIQTSKNILLNKHFSLLDLDAKIKELKKEKEAILINANLPCDYLTPKFECSICKDTGYIWKDNYKSEMCNCLKQKLLDYAFNNSNLSNLEKENFNTFNLQFFSNETDLAKYHFNISPRKNMENIRNKCINFIENFNNPDTKNLLFTGNTGLRQDFYVQLYC